MRTPGSERGAAGNGGPYRDSNIRVKIEELNGIGLGQRAIARELGVAPATVVYHLRRLVRDHAESSPSPATRPGTSSGSIKGPEAVRESSTRAQVAELLDRGVARIEIARRLGLSKATVSYHARRLGRPIDKRCARRYDWDAVQRHYDDGHSVRDCIETFGFSSASWFDAVKRGAIIARPAATPIAELLVAGTYRGRYSLKLRLVREGLKENRCEQCGLSEWRDQPLTLALHHVNGQRDDNRIQNLQLLCPNCHSQTTNYAGRNGRAARPPPRPPRGVTIRRRQRGCPPVDHAVLGRSDGAQVG